MSDEEQNAPKTKKATKAPKATPGAGEDCRIETNRLSRYRNKFRNLRAQGKVDGLSFRVWMKTLELDAEGGETEAFELVATAKASASPKKRPRPKLWTKNKDKKKVKNESKKKKKKKADAEEE